MATRNRGIGAPARWWIPLAGLGLSIGLLALAGCSQNVETLDGKNPPPPPPASEQQPASEMPDHPRDQPSAMPRGLSANDLASDTDQGTPPGISGTVTLDSQVMGKIRPGAVLFLIARDDSGSPVAVKRVAAPVFPLRYFLGQESIMFEGNKLEGKVHLMARIAQSGSAGTVQPGDLEGLAASEPVKVGADNVEICIDQVK